MMKKNLEPAIEITESRLLGTRSEIRRSGGVSLARMKYRVLLGNQRGDGRRYRRCNRVSCDASDWVPPWRGGWRRRGWRHGRCCRRSLNAPQLINPRRLARAIRYAFCERPRRGGLDLS